MTAVAFLTGFAVFAAVIAAACVVQIIRTEIATRRAPTDIPADKVAKAAWSARDRAAFRAWSTVR
jgi:hypothetical protein